MRTGQSYVLSFSLFNMESNLSKLSFTPLLISSIYHGSTHFAWLLTPLLGYPFPSLSPMHRWLSQKERHRNTVPHWAQESMLGTTTL
jgi:hypothetical protein